MARKPSEAMSNYGCHNRPPFLPIVRVEKAGQVAQWPFAMSPDCNYTHTDLGRVDPRCEGCKHKAEAKQ